MLTEHYSTSFDTSAKTLSGFYGSTLFIAGNEINTRDGDRFLMLPGGADAADLRLMNRAQALERVRSQGRLALLAYPERSSPVENEVDGMEVFNLGTSLSQVNPVIAALDLPWSFSGYPELSIARFLVRPEKNLKMYDERIQQRKLALIAGLDAHSALGFHVFGDELGYEILRFKVDDYNTVFRIARLHVLTKAEHVDQGDLLDQIRRGRFFVGFDVLGDTDGFNFTVVADGKAVTMGDELSMAPRLTLSATAPIPARYCVFKNGEKISDVSDATTRLDIKLPGEYRVEVYRNDLGSAFTNVPWILSNPIYIR